MSDTANEILTHVNAQLPLFWEPMLLLSSLTGAVLLVYGVVAIVRAGRDDRAGWRGPVLSIVAGTLLINVVAGMMSATTETLFGGDAVAPTALSYSPPATVADALSPYLVFAVHATTLIGFYGIIRGLWLIHEIGRGRAQESGFWAASVHIVFGALAANIVATANALGYTMGPTMRGFVEYLLGAG